MSYRGRPSKGCESCRSRKVKCDEAKPICSRCSRSGNDCKYRDQADLLFRNQTAFAAQKAEEAWRKRSKSNQRGASDSNITYRTSSSPSDKQSPNSQQNPSPSITYSPPPSETASEGAAAHWNFNDLSIGPDLEANVRRLAYERFIYDFVVFETPNKAEGQLSDSLWDFVPHLYQNSAEGSCLRTIVDAVAYTNFANRCNAPQMHKLAERYLGKGIRLLQKTISDKELAPSDSTLCSVYLMGVYETLSPGQRQGSFLAHSSGANALLQLRTIEEFYTNPISARLYEVSYAQMLIFWQQLIGNLQAGKPPAIPIRNIATARQYLPTFYSTSGVYVIQLIYNEARLHAEWQEHKQSSSPPTNRIELQGLLKTALELDAEFQAWESTIPRSWRHQMEPNTPEARATYDVKWRNLILGTRGAPEEIHSYTALRRCWAWMFYRTSRIFLLRDILEILNWMFRLPQPEIDVSSSFNDMSTIGTYPSVASLDNITLHVHRAFTTTHLVNIIEKSCSAILGHFTVPVYGKSIDDVMGMRGYTTLWSLGVMDAVLRAGLVPDSGAPASPPGASLGQQIASPPTLSLQFQGPLAVSAAMFGTSTEPSSSLYTTNTPPTIYEHPNFPTSAPQQHTPTAIYQHRNFPTSTPPQQYTPNHSRHPSTSGSTTPLPSEIPTTPRDPTRHIFDSSPLHPFDLPTNLPTLDFNITKPKQIDVAARREWINRMLYYIGSELGIKKALVVPATEGYLETSKLGLDAMLGR